MWVIKRFVKNEKVERWEKTCRLPEKKTSGAGKKRCQAPVKEMPGAGKKDWETLA